MSMANSMPMKITACTRAGPPVRARSSTRLKKLFTKPKKTAHGLKFSETDVHIVCPWHGYEYNVRDGRHPGSKNIRLRPFKVDVKDGEVYVVV